MITWFLFDLGNTLIKLAYERVLEAVCRNASTSRDQLVELLEQPGGYRDMERGAVTFRDFYDFVCDKAGYRGSLQELQKIWSDFFDGTMPGMEDLLDKVRDKYRVAFLSNSNEIHAELIPRRFGTLFKKDDRFIFSHRFKVAKPDPEIFRRALEVLGALPHQVVFIDDLRENVLAAQEVGLRAFHFRGAGQLIGELQREELL
jgi:glucose-1-phosphatase